MAPPAVLGPCSLSVNWSEGIITRKAEMRSWGETKGGFRQEGQQS